MTQVLGTYSSERPTNQQPSFRYPLTTGSPVLFDVKYSGTDDFRVFLIDAAGEEYERSLAPNRLHGPYEGVRAMVYRDGVFEGQEEEVHAFRIRAEGDGSWQVEVGLPDFSSPSITSASGSGDQVVGPFALRTWNPFVTDFVFEITHRGHEFEARLIASDGSAAPLVPRQVAPFENSRRTVNVFAPPNPDRGPDGLTYDDYVLEVHADGEWTIRLLEPVSGPVSAPEPMAAPRGEIPFKRTLEVYGGVGDGEFEYAFPHAEVPSAPILFAVDFRGWSAFEAVLEDVFDQFGWRLTPDALIGPYRGLRALSYNDGLLDGNPISKLDLHVEAFGPWEIRFGLPDFESPPIRWAEGRGDQVVGPFSLASATESQSDFVFRTAHAGANFEARLIAADGMEVPLIPPQHVPFRNKRTALTVYGPTVADTHAGDVPYGLYVLAIQADDEWSVGLLEPEFDTVR